MLAFQSDLVYNTRQKIASSPVLWYSAAISNNKNIRMYNSELGYDPEVTPEVPVEEAPAEETAVEEAPVAEDVVAEVSDEVEADVADEDEELVAEEEDLGPLVESEE